jgi:hypothetical protein
LITGGASMQGDEYIHPARVTQGKTTLGGAAEAFSRIVKVPLNQPPRRRS